MSFVGDIVDAISAPFQAVFDFIAPQEFDANQFEQTFAGREVQAVDSIVPRRLAYGRCKLGWSMAWHRSTNGDKDRYFAVLPIVDHPTEAIQQVIIGDDVLDVGTELQTDAGHADGFSFPELQGTWLRPRHDTKYFPSGQEGADKYFFSCRLYNGAQLVTDPRLSGFAGGAYSGTRIFTDTTYAIVEFRADNQLNLGGQIPPVYFVGQWKNNILDVRDSQTKYTANAVLCFVDYLIEQFGYLGLSIADFTGSALASLIEAANVCDELVDLEAGGTQPRYEIRGHVDLDHNPEDVIQQMVMSFAGHWFQRAGKQWIIAGAPRVKVADLTLDHMTGDSIRFDRRHPLGDRFNTVRGSYISAEHRFNPVDFPQVSDAAFVAADNGQVLTQDVKFDFVIGTERAQRIAGIILRRHRHEKTVTAQFKGRTFALDPGDVVSLTWPRLGTTSTSLFWVNSLSKDASTGQVTLVLREYSDAIYGGTPAVESVGQDPDLWDGIPSAPTGITATNIGTTGIPSGGGDYWVNVLIDWDDSPNGFIDGYRIRWRMSTDNFPSARWGDGSAYVSDQQWSSMRVDHQTEATLLLRDEAIYEIQVRAEASAIGTFSAWAPDPPLEHEIDTDVPRLPGPVRTVGGQNEVPNPDFEQGSPGWIIDLDGNEGAAAPVVASRTEAATDGSDATITIAKPSGTTVDDVLWVVVNAAADAVTDIDAPADTNPWVTDETPILTSPGHALASFRKVVTSDDAALTDFTFTADATSAMAAIMVRVTGADPADPVDAYVSAVIASALGYGAIPELGALADRRLVLGTVATDETALDAAPGTPWALLDTIRTVNDSAEVGVVSRLSDQPAGAFGLIDFGADNDAILDRHYLIDNAATILNLNATSGWAWGVFTRLTENAGSAARYLLSSGNLNANPSFNWFIAEASQSVPNSYGANVSDGSSDNPAVSSAGQVTLGQLRLVVVQRNTATGNMELYTCDPGGSPVLIATATGPDGDMTAPTDWFFGRRSDGDAARYFQGEMGGLWKASRTLTTQEIADIAAGADPLQLIGEPDLRGLWAFKHGPVAVEPDLTANGNDAVRQGTGWGTPWPLAASDESIGVAIAFQPPGAAADIDNNSYSFEATGGLVGPRRFAMTVDGTETPIRSAVHLKSVARFPCFPGERRLVQCRVRLDAGQAVTDTEVAVKLSFHDTNDVFIDSIDAYAITDVSSPTAFAAAGVWYLIGGVITVPDDPDIVTCRMEVVGRGNNDVAKSYSIDGIFEARLDSYPVADTYASGAIVTSSATFITLLDSVPVTAPTREVQVFVLGRAQAENTGGTITRVHIRIIRTLASDPDNVANHVELIEDSSVAFSTGGGGGFSPISFVASDLLPDEQAYIYRLQGRKADDAGEARFFQLSITPLLA